MMDMFKTRKDIVDEVLDKLGPRGLIALMQYLAEVPFYEGITAERFAEAARAQLNEVSYEERIKVMAGVALLCDMLADMLPKRQGEVVFDG